LTPAGETRSAWLALLTLPFLSPVFAAPSITYPAGPGPGAGRHLVFLTGDEEYRGEEGLPMLAKLLSQRHGFRCTVLFPLDPDGTINPNCRTDPKPIRWDYLDNPYRHRLHDVTRALLYLRNNYDAFETTNYSVGGLGSGQIRSLILGGSDLRVIVIANVGTTVATPSTWWPAPIPSSCSPANTGFISISS
jgi:hypothetical protein